MLTSRCKHCGKTIEIKGRGRTRRYCSGACRTAHHRKEQSYYRNEAFFESAWERMIRVEQLQSFDPKTLEIIKHIMHYNGGYVAGMVVRAIRTEIKAREAARPKRQRKVPPEVESTVTYPEQ